MTVFSRVVLAFFAPALVGLAACSGDGGTGPSAGGVTSLQIEELRIGTGTEAVAGRTLTVRYTGWLYDNRQANKKGTQFDSGTYSFVSGSGMAIGGFDQGALGMRVGGQRRVTIPPSLGYGSQGSGIIPGNASLIFELELLAVQ